ncbi:MAG TPA: hypothetical protein VFE05_18580 [Longimicrobiaceae bacterium]|jgi:hypothetical protein|nr:hypothetical protein [Longimicrobiaceae bacterium]
MKRIFLALALLAAPAPALLNAQAPGGWNNPRALELIHRAEVRRATNLADTGMVDYQADARGYVYFYLDRRDIGERTLVKTDQVALDVMWKAPNLSKQRIIGLRDEKKLPTTIQYHQDHLSVVQDNFGDLIRIGDGDEVRDVLHPAAAGGPQVYEYRLADSSAIRLPGGEAVQLYEIQVRPRDPSRPAFIGSVFVDRRMGDIVRMSFTFTSPAYVDRQLDYLNVSLENGLWKGRFWLPSRQQVEIRRQLPELGFPAGGVIRGTMRISNYRFNQGLPLVAFSGPKVVSVPDPQRRAFPFERGIYEELREEGIGPSTELGDIRRQAAELIRQRMLSGLPALRLDVPAVSQVFRYNRAEGPTVGFGVREHPRERLTLSFDGGWAFGPEHPVLSAGAQWTRPSYRIGGSAFLNTPRDVGVGPVVSGAVNSLTALLAGRDYTDLFYARGGELHGERKVGFGLTGGLTLRAEDQASASREADFSVFGGSDHFRPVHAIGDGVMLGGSLSLARSSPSGTARAWSASLTTEGGTLRADSGGSLNFVRPVLDLGYTRRFLARDAALEMEASGGAAFGDLPRQELFRFSGRGTVPGFDFRSFGGDRFALARATASADLLRPWVRGRLMASAGWAGVGDAGRPALSAWGAETTQRPRASIGAGVGLVYDILRLDVHRGMGAGGRWEVVVDARPSFWDFL